MKRHDLLLLVEPAHKKLFSTSSHSFTPAYISACRVKPRYKYLSPFFIYNNFGIQAVFTVFTYQKVVFVCSIHHLKITFLCLPYRLDDCTNLRCSTVEQDADAVDFCSDKSNAYGRANQDGNGDQNLIQWHRAHADPRKHSHR